MGTTIIMVTHDPELARRAHRNVHIVDGQISDLKPYETARGLAREARARRRLGDVARLRRSRCSATTCSSPSATCAATRVSPRSMIGAVALGIARLRHDAHDVPRDVRQPDLVEERRALRRHDGFLGPAAAELRQEARASARAADVSRRDGRVPVGHPEAQGDHAQGRRHPLGRWPAGEARARDDARDDQGFLRDLRRAVPVRRHLDRCRGLRSGARARHLAQDERASSSAAPTASASASAGTTTSSASSACATTGCRCRRSTTSTTARSRSRRTSTSRSAGTPRSSCQAPATRNGWKPEDVNSFQDFLNSELVWIQMWVELPDAAAHDRFQAFLDNYAQEQKKAGRYQRPLNNRLTKPDQWLVDNNVVSNDDRVLVGLAVRLPRGLPPEYRRAAAGEIPEQRADDAACAARWARAASRSSTQHLVEVGVISSIGALLGLVLGATLLMGLRRALHRGSDRRRRDRRRSRTWTSRAS